MNNSEAVNRLAKKLKRRTDILTDAEVRLVTKHMRKALGSELIEAARHYDVRFEDRVRWSSLQARCEEERAARQLTVKGVSSQVKIPQYRLKAIEEGHLREFKAEFARRYFEYLGIESWVRRWARANHGLARRAGLTCYLGDSRRSR